MNITLFTFRSQHVHKQGKTRAAAPKSPHLSPLPEINIRNQPYLKLIRTYIQLR